MYQIIDNNHNFIQINKRNFTLQVKPRKRAGVIREGKSADSFSDHLASNLASFGAAKNFEHSKFSCLFLSRPGSDKHAESKTGWGDAKKDKSVPLCYNVEMKTNSLFTIFRGI